MNEQFRRLIDNYVTERTGQILMEAMEENQKYIDTLDKLDYLVDSLNKVITPKAEQIFKEYAETRNYESAIIEGILYLQGVVDGISMYNNAKRI